MKTCPICHCPNAAENRFCQQCGRPLDGTSPRPGVEATVLLTGTQLARGPLQHTYDVSALLGGKNRLVVGRAPDCDVRLAHPTVSRYHALLERRGDGLWLLDLGSVNGVSVGGRRLIEAARVHEGDRVGIGPFLLSLTGGVLHSLDNSRCVRLEAQHLEKVVRLPDGSPRKLLDDVNLVVDPGEFVTLLGPSGSGKSTLMDCLNGRRRATGGQVLANGEDFYRHFDNFRQSLGYVPQKDIVHTQLTVYRALYYTARLRLPPDTDPDELRDRIEAVLKEMELGPHRDTLVGDLSGGQIKRVSLGAELLAEPSLLYIDEATSGLDAGTEARMMRLFRRLADQGRSIVCITHALENVEQCHLALVLARGKLVYYGPPGEAARYFKVKRIGDVYDRLGERDVTEWEKEFAASALYREFVLQRLARRAAAPVGSQGLAPPIGSQGLPPLAIDSRPSGAPENAPAAPPAPAAEPGPAPLGLSRLLADSRRLMAHWEPLADRFRDLTGRYLRLRERLAPLREGWHQFRVLTARYVELTLGDRRGLRLLLLQAPIVAAFLLIGFVGKDYQKPIPLPRELTTDERHMLTVLRGLDHALAEDRPLDAGQRRALKQVRFKVEGAGVPRLTVDGTQAVALLRRLQQKRLSSSQQEALEKARFTLEVDGEPVPVTGAEVIRAWRQYRQLRLPEKLLAYNGAIMPDREWINPRYTYILLFIIVMIVLWFGCNNAAKEIVKEEAIYGRERAVNLGIVPYLASKFLVLGAITVFHALVLLGVLFGTLEVLRVLLPGHSVPSPEQMIGYWPTFGVIVLLALAGVALGLLLSACVSTPDRANALLPYVLIPQMILGGGILSVQKGALYYLAVTLSPVYWAYRALHRGAGMLPREFPGHASHPEGVLLPCEALLLQTAVLLALTAWFLRRKDA
jgi:ABC-type multidrug transport system ATPase subunit